MSPSERCDLTWQRVVCLEAGPCVWMRTHPDSMGKAGKWYTCPGHPAKVNEDKAGLRENRAGGAREPPTLGKWAVTTIICKTTGEIKYSSRGYLKGFPGGSDGKESACDVGDPGSTAGSGRPPGEGNDNPLQYPCLENPMDRGAWWATVHGVTRSQTPLSN